MHQMNKGIRLRAACSGSDERHTLLQAAGNLPEQLAVEAADGMGFGDQLCLDELEYAFFYRKSGRSGLWS